MTPEGRVKNAVKKLLKKYPLVYQFWPVQSGYGAKTLDCLLCVNGYFVSVETKAPGKKPTELQWRTIVDIKLAGGIALVIDSVEAVTILEAHLIRRLYAGTRKPQAQGSLRSRRPSRSKSFPSGKDDARSVYIAGASWPYRDFRAYVNFHGYPQDISQRLLVN